METDDGGTIGENAHFVERAHGSRRERRALWGHGMVLAVAAAVMLIVDAATGDRVLEWSQWALLAWAAAFTLHAVSVFFRVPRLEARKVERFLDKQRAREMLRKRREL